MYQKQNQLKEIKTTLGSTQPLPETTSCSRCGECCRYIAIGYYGITNDLRDWCIARGLKLDAQQGLFLIPHICQHLNSESTCNIYEDRPKHCRVFKGRKQAKGQKFWIPPSCTMVRK